MIETKALYAAATLTAIAVIFYETLVLRVNPARRRYDVKSPATAGNVEFERILRTQQNTLEQLPAFLAGLWLAAIFGGAFFTWICGSIWLVARLVYVWLYARGLPRAYATIPAYIVIFVMNGFSLAIIALRMME